MFETNATREIARELLERFLYHNGAAFCERSTLVTLQALIKEHLEAPDTE